MEYEYDDGGREAAGYKGVAGDCVVRAISIALEEPYRRVYRELHRRKKQWLLFSNTKQAAQFSRFSGREFFSPRSGMPKTVAHKLMLDRGWVWVPTLKFGSRLRVHLCAEELPGGRLVATVSQHWCAIIDGVVRDNHDPRDNGRRCVFGYYWPGK